MRNLFAFLLRYHYFLLFVLLEVLAIMMLARNNRYQGSVLFNTMAGVTGSLNSSVANITDYFRLKEVNRSLSAENARLKAQLEEARLIRISRSVTRTDTALKQEYTFTPARIVHNSIASRNNYLMINKGSHDGIRPDMAVIGPDGIVGIVANVSNNFAWIISVLHKQTKISAKIKKNGFVGTLVWNGVSYHRGELKDIPANVLIAKGDTVITSGYSSIFPQGIMIGTIRDFRVATGYNFYDIELDFSQDYNKISWVYVVTDFFKEEKTYLERFTVDE